MTIQEMQGIWVNESVEQVKQLREYADHLRTWKNIPLETNKTLLNQAADTIEVLLAELEQYRAIGTPDECRAAVVKQRARDTVFRRCICEYGIQPQIDVAIEEMSELTKALLKWRRAKGAELTAARDNIIDEIADVRIMCRQMEILFQAEYEVDRRIDFKVDRQRKRLHERKEGENGNN